MTRSNIKIRQAALTDAKAIAEIYNDAIDDQRSAHMDHVTEEERREWLQAHKEPYPVFVYDKGGEVLAWVSISAYRKGRRALAGAVEVSYYVDYAHHGEGIGSALMEKAIAYCHSAGFEHVFAILLEDNAASIGLLEKYGFELWGRLPGIANYDGRRVGQVYYGREV